MIRLFLDTNDTEAIKSGNNSTPSDTSFIFGDVMNDQITNVSVFLESASIPITVYPFTSSNNTFSFFENLGAVQRNAVIPVGSYTGTELATALQTAMNAVGSNVYTISYSTITKKLTISTVLPSTFRILSASTCLNRLGYEPMTTFQTARSSDYMVNLQGSRYVDMCVNFNTSSIALNKRGNILARIPLGASTGNIYFYQPNLAVESVVNASSLRNIEVRLYDDTGNLYNTDKNHQITYTLILKPLD